jgi:hypothetical protein
MLAMLAMVFVVVIVVVFIGGVGSDCRVVTRITGRRGGRIVIGSACCESAKEHYRSANTNDSCSQ